MQAAPSSQGALPHYESKRIIQDLFPERASVDDFQDAQGAIPEAVANNSATPAIVGHSRTIADATVESSSAERESSDTLRDEKRGTITTEGGGNNGAYRSSSGTIGDEEQQDLKAQEGAPLGRNSNSLIGDGEKQGRGDQQNYADDRLSTDTSHDLEKGETDSQEHNEVDQHGEDQRQTQWENNVVGWDGPNDPQNPHNWKKSKKYTVTVLYSSLTLCITFASSIFSTATMVTAKMFGVSNEVMTLGTSLFVLVRGHFWLHPVSADKNDRASPSAQ